MALPSKANIESLDVVGPWGPVSSSIAGTGTGGEAVGPWGPIYVLSAGAAAASGTNVFVNISGTWKEADSVHVNVSGTWKNMSEVKVNVGGAWKSV